MLKDVIKIERKIKNKNIILINNII
jgi:hypothetical protein